MQQDYIDKNLSVEKTIHKDGLMFYNVKEPPFDLYGFYSANKNELFKRLPDNIARQTSQGVATLYTNTSGGRVRFGTDSKKIAIIAKLPDVCYKPHMPLSCIMGFDLYSCNNSTYSYVKTFIPPFDTISGYESYYEFPDAKMRDLTLNFPLYNNVSELYIGIDDKGSIYPGKHYSNTKPVVYYGSSITQGACASRPGNCYANILMREFDIDFINLGFAGSAKGEECISKYIADMEMSCFVLDYDYNAPSPEHLQNTHEAMFLKKVLVLGGTGAMGVYVVPELLRLGYKTDVVALDNIGVDNDCLRFIKKNGKDISVLTEILKNDYDAIIDFMLYTTDEFKDCYELFLKNTKHYIFLSSYRVYADKDIKRKLKSFLK